MHYLNPLRWFRWIGQFVHEWFVAIPWNDAPKAIPAIILTIVLFTTGFIAFSGGTGWRNRLLNRQLQVSLDRDDFATAEIVVRRQLDADPDDIDLVHRFALIREAQGFSDETRVLMEKLLHRRHLPAARWLLKNEFVGKQWGSLDAEKRDQFGEVLAMIHRSAPKDTAVTKMYAEYLIVSQRYASAIPLLDELSEVEPMRGLQAAALSRQIGDKVAAERFAERALSRVTEMSKDDPTNTALAMAVARNQVFLQRHADAVKTLDRSVKVAKTPEERQVLSQALGDAIVAWVKFIEESPVDTIQGRLRVLKMLQAALRYAPNNPRVVTLVADHVLRSTDDSGDSESAGERRAELESVRQALVSGSSPGIAHFIKGTSALMAEDAQQASFHLGLAAEMMPRSGAILNNLAVALAMKEEPDYPRALKVANSAIEFVEQPTPHFYETRGQILFRMGRFRQAIPDLERALAEPSLSKKAHQMLADCYQQEGDEELAESHRAAAGDS
ncbi:tetratricopeptide repeat protein [Roseiconus nitratireducens]|nr:hypothetical protein [Roseiconus nitratireducens]